MSEKMTCEKFNELLTDFALGRASTADAAAMEGHLASCASCRDIFEIKRALIFDPWKPAEPVPDDVEESLINAVLVDVAAAREAGLNRRSWASRFIMPAMAAGIVLFVFFTGFMLNEIRNLHSENGELRNEVAVMETALAHAGDPGTAVSGERSVFGRMTGGLPPASEGMTLGEAARFLEGLPDDTPVLGEREAEEFIAGNRRLRRLAGYMKMRPWEGGLTSGELLIVIVDLDLDPETRIPDEWRPRSVKIRDDTDGI